MTDLIPEGADVVPVTVHNGYAIAYVQRRAVGSPHIPVECNAYCKPDLHCDIFFGPEGESAEAMLGAVQQILANWIIVRIEPASNEAQPPAMDKMITVGQRDSRRAVAWLLFWRKP